MGFIKSGDDLLSRCSHYHRPQVLNGRVRNGNGCGHLGMVTGKLAGKQECFPRYIKKAAAGEFLVGSTEPESQANGGHPHHACRRESMRSSGWLLVPVR